MKKDKLTNGLFLGSSAILKLILDPPLSVPFSRRV
jgi:hypothetical protein